MFPENDVTTFKHGRGRRVFSVFDDADAAAGKANSALLLLPSALLPPSLLS